MLHPFIYPPLVHLFTCLPIYQAFTSLLYLCLPCLHLVTISVVVLHLLSLLLSYTCLPVDLFTMPLPPLILMFTMLTMFILLLSISIEVLHLSSHTLVYLFTHLPSIYLPLILIVVDQALVLVCLPYNSTIDLVYLLLSNGITLPLVYTLLSIDYTHLDGAARHLGVVYAFLGFQSGYNG